MTKKSSDNTSPQAEANHETHDDEWLHHRLAHDLVLSLSGWLSDELIANARGLNSSGQFSDMARSAAYAILSQGLPTTEMAALAIGTLLERGASSDEQLAEIDEIVQAILGNTNGHADHAVPSFDYSSDSTSGDVDVDKIVARVKANKDALAIWRTERRPLLDAPWPPARDVFVVEADVDTDLVKLTTTFTKLIVKHGVQLPLIEVREVGTFLTGYHAALIEHGELLWARRPRNELVVIDVFDDVVDGVGAFSSDHATIPDTEREEVVSYLENGTAVLETFGYIDDVIDSTVKATVPTTVRTDGQFVWSDATAYYLRHHALAPQAEFLEHITSADSAPEPVDSDVLLRATRLINSEPEAA